MYTPPLPGLPSTLVPVVRSVDSEGLEAAVDILGALPGLPEIGGYTESESGRAREAAEYAASVGKAFGFTKDQLKVSKQRAKARNKAQQRIAERR